MYKIEMHENYRNSWLRIEADGVTVTYKRDGICEAKRTCATMGEAVKLFCRMADALAKGRYCEEQRVAIIKGEL